MVAKGDELPMTGTKHNESCRKGWLLVVLQMSIASIPVEPPDDGDSKVHGQRMMIGSEKLWGTHCADGWFGTPGAAK